MKKEHKAILGREYGRGIQGWRDHHRYASTFRGTTATALLHRAISQGIATRLYAVPFPIIPGELSRVP
jgi:hypothetical protein